MYFKIHYNYSILFIQKIVYIEIDFKNNATNISFIYASSNSICFKTVRGSKLSLGSTP